MDSFSTIWLLAYLAAGLYLLVQGAEHLIDGASALALRVGVGPFVVGLTIVAFGTSAPELATVVSALLHVTPEAPGPASLALGNVVGSNICNVALILGIATMLHSIRVESQLVRRELPVLLVLTLLLAGLTYTGTLGRLGGAVLLVIFIAFMGHVALSALRDRRAAREEAAVALAAEDVDVERLEGMKVSHGVFAVVGGLLLLSVGAELLVDSAEALARRLDVSEGLIGLTIVAFGTSLPELATTIVASRRSTLDLALGNVIGSNIFNIGLVVGLPATVLSWPPTERMVLDLVVMVLLAVAVAAIAWFRRCFDRFAGILLLATYAVWLVATTVVAWPTGSN